VNVFLLLCTPELRGRGLGAGERLAKDMARDVPLNTFVQGAAYNSTHSRPELVADPSQPARLSGVDPGGIVSLE
jgi:hypothetical protein